jgi:hypothetical protein
MVMSVTIPSTQVPLMRNAAARKDGRILAASTVSLRSMFNQGWIERDAPLSPNWSLTDKGRKAYATWDLEHREALKNKMYSADVVFRHDMSYEELKATWEKHKSQG